MSNIIVDLGRKYATARAANETQKLEQKKTQEAEDTAEKELIEAMIEAETGSIAIDGVGRITLRRQVYPSVNAANKPQFFEYLKASGNEGLLKLDVHAKTLESFLKKHKEELVKQMQDTGITLEQAKMVATFPEYSDAAKSVGQPVDEMAATELADAVLKSQGAAIFSKQSISLTKNA